MAGASHALVGFTRYAKDGTYSIPTFSVVPVSTIRGDLKLNTHVEVLYGRKAHPAILERLSGDKNYLRSLCMDKMGTVGVVPATVAKDLKAKKASANDSTQKALRESEKDNKKLANKVQSNLRRMVSKTRRCSDLEPPKKRQDVDISSEEECDAPGEPSEGSSRTDEGGQDSDPSETSSGYPTSNVSVTESVAESEQFIDMKVTKAEQRFILNVLRNPMCPIVSLGSLEQFQTTLNFFKALATAKVLPAGKSQTEHDLPAEMLREIRGKSSFSDTKVELMPGSDVWVDAVSKKTLTSMYSADPVDLARRLLKLLVGDKNLAGMSVLGHRQFPKIPAEIFAAVKGYVTEVGPDAMPKDAVFNRAINAMCGNIRRSLGLQEKKSPKESHISGRDNTPVTHLQLNQPPLTSSVRNTQQSPNMTPPASQHTLTVRSPAGQPLFFQFPPYDSSNSFPCYESSDTLSTIITSTQTVLNGPADV